MNCHRVLFVLLNCFVSCFLLKSLCRVNNWFWIFFITLVGVSHHSYADVPDIEHAGWYFWVDVKKDEASESLPDMNGSLSLLDGDVSYDGNVRIKFTVGSSLNCQYIYAVKGKAAEGAGWELLKNSDYTSSKNYVMSIVRPVGVHQLQGLIYGFGNNCPSYTFFGFSTTGEPRPITIPISWDKGLVVTVNKNPPGISNISASHSDSYDGKYSVSWSKANGPVEFYKLQQKIDQGNWTNFGDFTNRSYSTNSNPKPEGHNYTYRVRACNSARCGSWSNNVTVKVPKNTAPEISLINPAGGEFVDLNQYLTLRTQATDNLAVSSVKFYRKIGSGSNVLLGSGTHVGNNIYTLTWSASPEAGDMEIWAVATDGHGASTESSRAHIEITANNPPTVALSVDQTTITEGQTVVLTGSAADSDGSVVSVQFYANGSLIGTASTAPFRINWSPANAGTYQITAKVTDDEGASGQSQPVQVMVNELTPPSAPTGLNSDKAQLNTGESFTVSWSASATSTSYILERNTGDGWHRLQNLNLLSRYEPNNTQGTYRYRVQGCNAAGCGDYSAEIEVEVVLSKPAAPDNLSINVVGEKTQNTGDFNLSWSAVSEPAADYYQVEERAGAQDGGADWSLIKDQLQSTHFTLSNKAPGQYSYRVKACNASGCSEGGEQLSTDVLAPVIQAAGVDCSGSCILVSGVGFNTSTTFTLTSADLDETFTGADIEWQDESLLQLPLGRRTAIFDALVRRQPMSLSITNPNTATDTVAVDITAEDVYNSMVMSSIALGPTGVIYVGSEDKLYALDPATGETIPGWPFTSEGLIKATPVIDSAGMAYVGSTDDHFYAIDVNGFEQWSTKTGGDILSSAVLDDQNTAYFGSMDGALYALNTGNGEIQWTYPAGIPIASTPVLSGDGNTVYFTAQNGELFAIGRGILGPDTLQWGSPSDSLLADHISAQGWQPETGDLSLYMRVARLYEALLRPTLKLNKEVLTFWTYALVNRASLEEAAAAFLTSDTASADALMALNDGAYVDALYERVFPQESPEQGQPTFTLADQLYDRSKLLALMDNGASRAAIAVLFSDALENTANDSILLSSFDYFYSSKYDQMAFSCDEGDEFTRDCDADGLPDYWEMVHFGDTRGQDGNSDADGDDISNLMAWQTRQDPCDNGCNKFLDSEAPASAPYVSSSDIQATASVGATAGEFRVDESGAATYRIPLGLPAGTAGVVPQVSLQYSSSAGNGLLGKGWNISGLSAISRCRQTLALDGVARAITWSDDDRFCLDGQRLILDSGNAYGAVGASYQTEIDSFATVTSVGGTAGHPNYFKVERKDGSVTYYGSDNDARQVTHDGKYTLSWVQKRFEDSVGNGIDYLYDNVISGHRIREIRYAYGNSSVAAVKVKFTYEDRDDDVQGFVAGYSFNTYKRLRQIQVLNDDALVRAYNLTYQVAIGSTLTTMSRLEAIEECVIDVCLPATEFTWFAPDELVEKDLDYSYGGQSWSYNPTLQHGYGFHSAPDGSIQLEHQDDQFVTDYTFADVNGDGLLDIVWIVSDWDDDGKIHDTTVRYALSNGKKFKDAKTLYTDSANYYDPTYKLHVLDYNADGRQDILLKRFDHSDLLLFLSKPQSDNSWKPSSSSINLGFSAKDLRVQDLNADGLADLLYLKNGTFYRRYLQHDTSQAVTSSRFYKFSAAEAVTFSGSSQNVVEGNTVAWPITTPTKFTEGQQSGADFNGDGRLDMIVSGGNFAGVNYFSWDRRYNRIMVATDDGFAPYGDKTSPLGDVSALSSTDLNELDALNQQQDLDDQINVVDINADGLSDLLIRNGRNWYYALSNGNGFEPRQKVIRLSSDNKKALQAFDYNQDGYQDLVWPDFDNNRLKARLWRAETRDFSSVVEIRSIAGSDKVSYMFADMNGDGAADYIQFKDSKLTNYLSTRTNEPRFVIGKITNGLGAETNVQYGTLATSGHYERVGGVNEFSSTDPICLPAFGGGQGGCFTLPPTVNSGEFYRNLNGDWDLPEGSQGFAKTDPVLELNGPMPVVTQVSSSAPTGQDPDAESAISYYYAEAKIQAMGRGMLGFKAIKTVDEQTGTETTSTYRQDYPFIGYPLTTSVRTSGGKLLSYAENTWELKDYDGESTQKPYRPYIAESVEQTYDLASNGSSQGQLLQTVTTENQYDDYGNPLEIKVTTQGGDTIIKTTANQYGSGTWEQRMGRLARTEVTTKRNGRQKTRISAFTYYGSGAYKGLLESETIEPDDATFRMTTTYDYDAFGNKVEATQSAAGVASRTSRTEYDSRGRYAERSYNSLNQLTEAVLERNHLGQPTLVENANGVRTHRQYTSFGAGYLTYSESGAASVTVSDWCGSSDCGVAGGTFKVSETPSGSELPAKVTIYDMLGRKVRESSLLFDGRYSHVDVEYDNLGRAARQSEPHTNGAQYWTIQQYDLLGRVVAVHSPRDDYQGSRLQYSGYTSITTNDLGQRKTEVKNVLGELVSVTDHLGGRLSYDYDVEGNLLTATSHGSPVDYHQVRVQMVYDKLGRKIAMNDPDKGTWTYRYNGFGELIEQTDAKGQVSRMEYDVLGRMVHRTDQLANGSLDGNTTWTYDIAAYGIGQLASVIDQTTEYAQLYEYDRFGRAYKTLTSHDNSGAHDYTAQTVYDAFGRVKREYDAFTQIAGGNQSGVEKHYNRFGYLTHVVDIASNDEVYRIDEVDSRGQVTQARYGNGLSSQYHYEADSGQLTHQNTQDALGMGSVQDISYQWDSVGNLTSRHNTSSVEGNQKNLLESFQYDDLNRLTSSTVNGTAKEVRYDSLGNITDKTGVGSYTYGQNGYGPHAVTSTSDGISYHYDANGNMTHDTAVGQLGGRTLRYTSFDKLNWVQKGNHTVTFKYNPNRSRYLREDTNTSTGVTTETRYLGAVERIEKSNSTSIEWKRYINGVAVYTVTTNAGGDIQGTQKAYLLKDHLGSTDVITDALGVVIESLSFDPWGERRNALDWDSLDIASLLDFNADFLDTTTRGFTGHEMLDSVGIIHMNGRIYDARLGRFLQADPFIQAAGDTQMYNRYSYVRNNPLAHTDPSVVY